MIGGIYFDLKINGKTVPVENEQDLVKLKAYIDECLTWVRHTPKFHALTSLALDFSEATDASSAPGGARGLLMARNSYPPVGLSGEQRGYTTIDYAIKALAMQGGKGSVAKTMEEALKLGWKTRSKELKNATRVFTIMVRQNAQYVTLKSQNMELTEKGWDQYHSMVQEENLDISDADDGGAQISSSDASEQGF